MKCYEVDTKLMDYLYGELRSAEHGVVLSHLKECVSCARKVDELKISKKLLKSLPEEEVPSHLNREFWKQEPTRESWLNLWSWRVASVAAGFVLGAFSFYLVRFHVLPHAFESKSLTVAHGTTSNTTAPLAMIEKAKKAKAPMLTAEVSYPERREEEYAPKQSVSRGRIENDNVESVSLGVTGGTRESFGPGASSVVGESESMPVATSIRTRWFSTKPFMMREGQQAVLPSRQARILLKDILYSPCTEYVTKCSWSGVGAIYEFYSEPNALAQTVFMKKNNQGYPIQMKLNETYLLEVWDISPTVVRTVIKTSQ